jgi:hypothetical protein
MFSVITWNLENFERAAASAERAVKDRYARKLQQISELITSAVPDLIGVQEVLAGPKNSRHRPLTTLPPHWGLSGRVPISAARPSRHSRGLAGPRPDRGRPHRLPRANRGRSPF